MEPVATPFFFYGLAGLAVISALLVITLKNPIHSAISLIVTLLSLAGLYLMLYAPFVAGVQIILYVGGIMVLFLFVIMLVNLDRAGREERYSRQWPAGLLASAVLGGLFVFVYAKGSSIFPQQIAMLPETSNTQQMGLALYQTYMLPFEIASLLLLVAIVGAVVLAKRKTVGE